MDFKETAEKIEIAFQDVPKKWDGKESIMAMKNAGYKHWRQMEWIGFYFQFLCERHLSNILQVPGPKYGKVEFDGFLEIPWDFKAHAINTSSHQVIVNDSQAISDGIDQYGAVGLILALGQIIYNDEARTFQSWHGKLKGGRSKYEEQRIQRGAWSRLRKVSFELKQISCIQIIPNTLIKTGSFQADFRNSNGKPRRAKVLLDLEKLDEELLHFTEF